MICYDLLGIMRSIVKSGLYSTAIAGKADDGASAGLYKTIKLDLEGNWSAEYVLMMLVTTKGN